MKKVRIIALAALLLMTAALLTGCGSKLVGEWALTGGDVYDQMMGLGSLDIEFKKGGELTMTMGALGITESQDGQWKEKGDSIIMTIDGEETVTTYKLDGDTLTLINEDESDMILTRKGD